MIDDEITAKTLTNEQIDSVYVGALGPFGPVSHRQADPDLMHACTVARNTHGDFTDAEQAAARETVAAAINAREIERHRKAGR